MNDQSRLSLSLRLVPFAFLAGLPLAPAQAQATSPQAVTISVPPGTGTFAIGVGANIAVVGIRPYSSTAKAVASGGSQAIEAMHLSPAIQAKTAHAADVAFVSGFNSIILIAAILSFAGAIAGFALTRSSDFVQQGAPPPKEAAAETAAEPATS